MGPLRHLRYVCVGSTLVRTSPSNVLVTGSRPTPVQNNGHLWKTKPLWKNSFVVGSPFQSKGQRKKKLFWGKSTFCVLERIFCLKVLKVFLYKNDFFGEKVFSFFLCCNLVRGEKRRIDIKPKQRMEDGNSSSTDQNCLNRYRMSWNLSSLDRISKTACSSNVQLSFICLNINIKSNFKSSELSTFLCWFFITNSCRMLRKVGRSVAFNIREPGFESSHRHFHLTVNYYENKTRR